MSKNIIMSSKPRYEILDGLRGVAAIMVVGFHVFEAYATSRFDQMLNHAYLAVDFFFMLSGFVIGYAYDDRWRSLSFFRFMKLRILRLQPMVVFGTMLGSALFYFGASAAFPVIATVPVWKLLLFALLSMLIIPTPTCADIRGNYPETYNLNGPIWSLSFEYGANILYALFVHKFTKKALAILVGVAACSTLYLALTQGEISGGWMLNGEHLYKGFTRVMFPFFGGLLLYRTGKVIHVKNAFLWCSLLLVALFTVPRIGGEQSLWMNGIYEVIVILIVFPLIVTTGAGSMVKGSFASRLCKLLGDISYPIYLINYPICYIQTGWVSDMRVNNPDFGIRDAGFIPILVFILILLLSYFVTRFYDIPVRKWLKKKL
jgi:peptidoglycan/LPS O-acetylase OafA/YrhL